MGKITLHTPIHLSDNETITEFEANDIIHIKSVVGDDDRGGTHFYVRGINERQYCSESANTLKKLVRDNKTEEKPFSIVQSGSGNAMAVGSDNQASTGKEGGWAISGWWITLIGTLIGMTALAWTIATVVGG